MSNQDNRLAKGAALVAFIQASLGIFIVAGMLDSPLPLYDDFATRRIAVIPTLAQSMVIAGFAIAFLQRRLWAAYGLMALAAMDAVLRGVAFGPVAALFSLFFIFAYWTGRCSLRRMDHLAPRLDELNSRRIIWLTIICVCGHWTFQLVGEITELRQSVPSLLAVGWDAALIAYLVTKEHKHTFESVIVWWMGIVILDLVVVTAMHTTLEQAPSVRVQIVVFLLHHIVVLLPIGLIAWGISEATRWLASPCGSRKVEAAL